MEAVPRGLRNNNPLNIRLSPRNNWVGRVAPSLNSDGSFEQFDMLEHGIRAALVLLRNYIKAGFNTPRLVISRWAPPSENNVGAYVRRACGSCGLGADDKLVKRIDVVRLCWAMSVVELGLVLDYDPFVRASNMLDWSAWL